MRTSGQWQGAVSSDRADDKAGHLYRKDDLGGGGGGSLLHAEPLP